MRSVAIQFAALCVVAAALAGTAEAHANYVRSNPAADARLVKPPAEIRVEFSEPPDPRGSELQVLDTAGKRYDKKDLSPSGDPNGLKVSVEPLQDGGYTVAWTATSAVDGHTTKGSFVFVVGSGPLPPVPKVADAAPPPTPLEIAGRALSYAGIALGLGTAFFVLFIAPRAADRREFWPLALAGSLIVAGSLALLVDQGTRLPLRLGALLALRALSGLALVAAAGGPRLASMRPLGALAGGGVMTLGPLASFRPRRMLALGAGIAAATTATLVSHATALGSPKDIALDFVHVLAVSVWTGGVVALIWCVLLPSRDDTPERARALGGTVWRFSITALAAVAVLGTTGVLQAVGRLVLVEDLYETPYGIALAAKTVLLLGALALAGLNLLRFGPVLRAGHRARRALLRDSLGEAGIFAAIFVASAFLTALAPPAQRSAAAFDETHRVAGLRLEMLVASAQPGRNRYVLRVREGLAPVQHAEKVAFRFTMVEHDMGETELVATERAAGEYVADGSPTAMYGTWRIQAIVRIAGREDVSTVFSFPVGAGSGTGSNARVISAPPYTLIAFTDPADPQAGAPFALFVVVVDGGGNPVGGKSVQASFSGPSSVQPIVARSDLATLGPGRYEVAVAALDAGTWQIAIAVGAETQGTYTLVVSR